MRWANFNISLPLSDRLFGTLESERRWLAAHDELESAAVKSVD